MKLKDYRYTGKRPLVLNDVETGAGEATRAMKDELLQRTAENLELTAKLQEKLYADGREGLIIALQAMDAAGKDSTIKNVLNGLNPQGVDVYSFKAPTAVELSHDYLWRIARCVPERGKIAIFNRSHYEDVLTVGVSRLYEHFKMPERCMGDGLIERRLEQIRSFEEYLYENGIRMIKLFLNVSKKEQKKRLLERLDKPEKNWKFSSSDLDSRNLWDDYQSAYEATINATATKHCPWYVLPADDKWFTRYLVSEAVADILTRIHPEYPLLPEAEAIKLPAYRQRLMDERDD